MKDWFDSEGWFFEDGVQDGRHFKAKINPEIKFYLVTIFWSFLVVFGKNDWHIIVAFSVL